MLGPFSAKGLVLESIVSPAYFLPCVDMRSAESALGSDRLLTRHTSYVVLIDRDVFLNSGD